MEDNAFRKIALALPEAQEQAHFDTPSFRVRGKIFAQLSTDGLNGLIKLPPERQEWLITTQPEACRAEPGWWGRHGWTWLKWNALASDQLEELITESWRMVAPRDLRQSYPAPPSD